MKDEKIDKVWYTVNRLYLEEPLRIANEHYSYADTLLIFIKAGKIIGIGEAAPDTEVTGETISSVKSFIDDFKQYVIGRSYKDIMAINNSLNKIADNNPSAMAGIDMALYDLLGKATKRNVVSILGGKSNSKQICYTIGIESDEKAVKDAIKYTKLGFKFLKVKVGTDPLIDAQRIKKIREAIGKKVKLLVDANQGYTVDQALDFISLVKDSGILFLEQPLKYSDLNGMAYLNKNSDIPIMADESAKTLTDVYKISKLKAASMINIKLMKMGGITRSLEVYKNAIKNNLSVMIGCMEESRVGISAGTSLSLSIKDIGFADLDSHLSHSNRLVNRGVSTKNGRNILAKGNGLGIIVRKK